MVGLLSSQFEELLRLLEQVVLLALDFFLHLAEEVLRVFELRLCDLVAALEVVLRVLLLGEALLGGGVLLLGGIEPLHVVLEDGVDGGHVAPLVRQFLGVRRQLVAFGGNLTCKVLLLFLGLRLFLAVLSELKGLGEDVGGNLFVALLLTLEALFISFEFTFSLVVKLLQI